MNTEQTSEALIEYSVTDAAIAEIKQKFSGLAISGVDDKTGYDLVHRSRLEVVGLRSEVERRRKNLKESSLVWGRKVDAEAKRITAALEEIEIPLKREEQRIDGEIQAEKDRVQKIIADRVNARLEALRAVNFHPDFTLSQDLAGMDEEVFLALLEDKTEADNLRKDAEAEAAAELEFLRANERERVRTEELKAVGVTDMPPNLRDMDELAYQAVIRRAREVVSERLDAQKLELEKQRKEINSERTKQRRERLESLLGIPGDDSTFEDLNNEAFEALFSDIKAKHEARLAAKDKERDAAAALQREQESREAALKPDREKLKAYISAVKNLPIPDMKTNPGKATMAKLQAGISAAIESLKG